jgi:hypothetical protein
MPAPAIAKIRVGYSAIPISDTNKVAAPMGTRNSASMTADRQRIHSQ